ncbi:hypothetical protein Rhopal_001525-T1 [Rhodotorula paludigena]|uniref:Chromatin assembly factor 1 subunit A dimerization domain-containing protein n=1 Tax=Rhodotorula paludigena TaxID=86838 RepID=A0AAV5GF99_9BASI|nr:hypothetical protein Rhopal_001525-T1 [Rhodotorula paludigena]
MSASTQATTAERVSKPASPAADTPRPDVLTLDDDSNSDDDDAATEGTRSKAGDAAMADADSREPSPSSKPAKDLAGKGTKRKSEAAPSSSQPALKKSKAADKDATNASTSTAAANKGEKALVELKGSKFVCHQKPLVVNTSRSYMNEMADFVEFAVDLFSKGDDSTKLDEWPEKHHGLVAKIVHESPFAIAGVVKKVTETLSTAIASGLAGLEDSQEGEALDEKAVAARIPSAPLKTLIQSLASRNNYGLSLQDIDDLPEGVKAVPTGLLIQVWEVKDEDLWVDEMRARLEKRKAERDEIRRVAIELFQALSEEEQAAVLTGDRKAAASTSEGTKAKSKGKGKEKVKAEDADDEDEGKARDEGEEKKETKPKKSKKKEKTEEEKREIEEKARLKAEKNAEKEAEKEAKRKEREEKRAQKEAEDAKKQARREEKERKKAAIEEEEKKKLAVAKKQKNMFTSFFVKKSASPGPAEAGPSTSPIADRSGKPRVSDFDRVFHPFNVRDKVTVAPVNKFLDSSRTDKIEVAFDSQPDLTLKDSLASFLSTASKRRLPRYDPHPEPPVNVRQCVVAINDSTLTSQDASEFYEVLKDREKVRVKLLKFHEDVRPGYVGTWTKVSHMVGPRTPFALETALLNYEHDSEGEWEEEPDDANAEDVNSDGARSDDDGEDVAGSDADSWLAEDDEIEYEEGYDADGDVVMAAAERGKLPGEEDDDDIVIVESEKEKKKEREAKKRKADKERKRKRDAQKGPMLPLIKGVALQTDLEEVEEPAFKAMRIHFLDDASFGLNPFTFVSKPFTAAPVAASAASATAAPAKGKENVAIGAVASSPAKLAAVPTLAPGSTGGVNTLKAKRGPPKQPFPEDKIERLVRLLHNSDRSRAVVVDDFFTLMKTEGTPVPKNTIEAKSKELCAKKVKGLLKVADDVRTLYNLSDE